MADEFMVQRAKALGETGMIKALESHPIEKIHEAKERKKKEPELELEINPKVEDSGTETAIDPQ